MKVEVSKNAAFCFGVKNAVSAVDDLLENNKSVCLLGNIVNNNQVIENFENRGVDIVKSVSDISKDKILVVRAHGEKKNIIENLKEKNINFVDATCPFVKKIHNIVKSESENRSFLLIAGKDSHPEVIGTRSYFLKQSYVFSNLEQLKNILKSNKFFLENGLMVSQTTFSVKEWKKCVEFISKSFTNIKIYDTICNVTNLRQIETEKMSKVYELMIVIGGHSSSNTNKLAEICRKNTNTIHIECLNDLKNYNLKVFESVGITAGASTSCEIVEEIKNFVKNF